MSHKPIGAQKAQNRVSPPLRGAESHNHLLLDLEIIGAYPPKEYRKKYHNNNKKLKILCPFVPYMPMIGLPNPNLFSSLGLSLLIQPSQLSDPTQSKEISISRVDAGKHREAKSRKNTTK